MSEEAKIGAFFDVDHTLIDVNSGRVYLEYLWKEGKISIPEAGRAIWWLAQYRMSLLDYDSMTAEIAKSYAGQKVAELESEVVGWFDREIKPHVCRQGKERVEYHRRQGHVLVMLTSGTEFSCKPLLELLDMKHLLCTRLDVEDGELTGGFTPPACYGPGKVTAAEAFADKHNVDLSRSYFYTDSYSDLPMLLRVGQPRVINPDPRLKRRASAEGWPAEVWKA